MAEGKNSFVLYTDLIHLVRKLPKETRGDLFLVILEYVNDNLDIVEVMEQADILLSATFEPIKQQLKRDLKKYKIRQQQRIDAGKRSAEARAAQRNPTTVDDNSISFGVSVSVNGSDSGNVNDNVSTKVDERENTPTLPEFIEISDISNFLNSVENVMWFESFCMNNKITPNQLRELIMEFENWLKDGGTEQKRKSDVKEHFRNWFNSKNYANNNRKQNNITNKGSCEKTLANGKPAFAD